VRKNSGITGKIKKALVDNITNEYKIELKENKVQVSTGYELREESNFNIKREHDELCYGKDSKCPKLFNDTNNV
jgi:hypothetical protein